MDQDLLAFVSVAITGGVALLATWAKIIGEKARIIERLARLESDRDEIKTVLKEVQEFLHKLDKQIDRPR